MKQHKNELDVDFMGGAAPLTKEEEKAISEFIKASKERLQNARPDKKHEPQTGVLLQAGGDKHNLSIVFAVRQQFRLDVHYPTLE